MDSITYSVIYFLDGQSLFDQKIQEGQEWQVDEVLDSLGSNLSLRMNAGKFFVRGNAEYNIFNCTLVFESFISE